MEKWRREKDEREGKKGVAQKKGREGRGEEEGNGEGEERVEEEGGGENGACAPRIINTCLPQPIKYLQERHPSGRWGDGVVGGVGGGAGGYAGPRITQWWGPPGRRGD